MRLRIGVARIIIATVMTTAAASSEIIMVLIDSTADFLSLEPMYWPITTVPPTLRPITILVIMNVT